MALREWSWQQFFQPFSPDEREGLLEILQVAYANECQVSTYLLREADGFRYPQHRQAIKQIAERDRAHAETLRTKVLALGATPREPAASASPGRTRWEQLNNILAMQREIQDRYLQGAFEVEDRDPEFADVLRRLSGEEEAQHGTLRDVLAQVDPYAMV
ncbi:MAG: ferritin-like domain-containing protein [Candidatus Methylomirabilales bacterium]